MHAILLAVVVASLSTSPASAPVSPARQNAIATPALEQAAPPTVSAPDRASLAVQIQDRVDQHKEIVQQLTARALAGDAAQRQQIQLQLQNAAHAMRLDIWQLQLDYARTTGQTELAERIESNITRLRELAEEPEIAVQAKRAPRSPNHTPEMPASVDTPVGNRSGLGTQGGQK